MKFLLIISLLFLKSSLAYSQKQKDEILKKDINAVIEELEFMYSFDQTLREYILYKTFDKCKTDSIENLDLPEKRKYLETNKFHSETLSSRINETYLVPVDNKNTERLIELTKKYGFPSTERLSNFYTGKLQEDFDPYIIFVHAQQKYWNELKEVLKEEVKQKNLNKCDYGHLMWHFSGRKDDSLLTQNGWKLEEKNGRKNWKRVECN